MSRFLFGVIFHRIDEAYESWARTSKKFDSYLYAIQQIGIEQELFISMVHKPSPYDFNPELAALLPSGLSEKDNKLYFIISSSPVDYVSDNLFIDWEYEASQSSYLPDKHIFWRLEKTLDQIYNLKHTQALWLRYKGMIASDLYQMDGLDNVEAKLYPFYVNQGYNIPDFEAYKNKSDN